MGEAFVLLILLALAIALGMWLFANLGGVVAVAVIGVVVIAALVIAGKLLGAVGEFLQKTGKTASPNRPPLTADTVQASMRKAIVVATNAEAARKEQERARVDADRVALQTASKPLITAIMAIKAELGKAQDVELTIADDMTSVRLVLARVPLSPFLMEEVYTIKAVPKTSPLAYRVTRGEGHSQYLDQEYSDLQGVLEWVMPTIARRMASNPRPRN